MSGASEPPATPADGEDGDQPTPIGVSCGVDTLLAAAPADGGVGTQFVIDGAHVRERYEILAEATESLQAAWFDTATGEAQLFAAVWHQLRAQVREAAVETVRHARRFDTPRIVLAAESVSPPPLWHRRTSDGMGAWLPSALRQAVAAAAHEAGVPVVHVESGDVWRACHRCGRDGEGRAGTFVCDHDDCPVGRVDATRSTAAGLAQLARMN